MKDKLPDQFASPTALPTDARREEWQQQNRTWWEQNPMRYDWKDEIHAEEFSREFFAEIDRRFFEDAEQYMPASVLPFDALIPFQELGALDVLEIGVGSGSHAELLAPRCRSYTGIDLTEYAVRSTRARLDHRGLRAPVVRMDAEQMTLPDDAFDLIWTWGVIHHSADTAKVLREMHRVLRPGGRAIVMVYHRSFLYAYIYTALLRGIFGGGLLKHSLHELLQLNTDGAIARFYRPREWRALIEQERFALEAQRIMGQKSEVILLPPGRIKQLITRATPNVLTRFITNTCRQGSFLITTIRKHG